MAGQVTTLKEGEAPESDDEDEQVRTSFMRNTMVCSTMVSGEASETDDEDDEPQRTNQSEKNSGVHDDSFHGDSFHGDTELVTEHDSSNVQSTISDDLGAQKPRRQKIVYKFDSPFHRKLRERNLTLRSDLVEGVAELYKSASAKLNSSIFHLTRAQQSALDVAENTRFVVEDMDTLCKHLDIITASEFLPSLQIQTSQE